MNVYDSSQATRFKSTLERRVTELQAELREPEDQRELAQDEPREVVDFKDMANEQTLAALEDVQAGHAADELTLALAALRRLDAGSYGRCLDCDEPIDLRRLEALPATPYCAPCQSIREHERPEAQRH